MKMVRGVRTNNPGNIKFNEANDWEGQTGQDADGYCVFDNPYHGIRAIALTLLTYRRKHQVVTIDALIKRWSSDNQRAYISFLCQRLSMLELEYLDVTNPYVMRDIIEAIIRFENGFDPYTDVMIWKCVELAMRGEE